MAANGSFTGSAEALAHLTPRPTQALFNDNYLSLDDLKFTQQFLPEVYEKEVERLGITPWKMRVFRPTGIKAFDNVVVANGLYFFEKEASFLLKSKTYKNAIPEVQKRMKRA